MRYSGCWRKGDRMCVRNTARAQGPTNHVVRRNMIPYRSGISSTSMWKACGSQKKIGRKRYACSLRNGRRSGISIPAGTFHPAVFAGIWSVRVVNMVCSKATHGWICRPCWTLPMSWCGAGRRVFICIPFTTARRCPPSGIAMQNG